MSCDGSLGTWVKAAGADPRVSAALGASSPQEAAKILEQIYSAASMGALDIAPKMQALAAANTLAAQIEMQSMGIKIVRHGSSRLPNPRAQLGFHAVMSTVRSAREGQTLPRLARKILVSRGKKLPADTGVTLEVSIEPQTDDPKNAALGHFLVDGDVLKALWLVGLSKQIPIVTLGSNKLLAHELTDLHAVVDLSKEHDPDLRRYDHHQWKEHATSAAQLVYDEMVKSGSPYVSPQLTEFVELVTEVDLGRRTERANRSREFGFHALVKEWTIQRLGDKEIIRRSFELFEEAFINGRCFEQVLVEKYQDDLQAYAVRQATNRRLYPEHVRYDSEESGGNGEFVLLENMHSDYAYERGVKTVMYYDTRSNGIGLMNRDKRIHAGDLVTRLAAEKPELAEELGSWFPHPVGFFAGRSGKADAKIDPPKISPHVLVKEIDRMRRIMIAEYEERERQALAEGQNTPSA